LLKVQDGCDFFCAYCIVPHTRGDPVSRPFDDCLREAARFIGEGYREIVVTGCNIACYADGGRRLPDLLDALAGLPDIGRLRLGSVEPGTVEGEVGALMAARGNICRFLHLPVQSGDDGVLTRMGRRYTAAQLAETVGRIEALMPDAAFGADVICGFPGETDAAFERTVQMIRDLPFSNLHVFPYSERPGTPASGFDGCVPPDERRRRAKRLIALGQEKRAAFARRFVGKTVEVLVEQFDREGRARGWSGEYVPCAVSGVPPDRLGSLCTVIPDRIEGDTLVISG
jgi:threonylcarbamoyladenosine tRNA methylthiotransferase MtaB